MRRAALPPAIAALVVALAVVGCGGGGSGATGAGSTINEAPPPSGAVVSATTIPGLGKVIVDSQGRTLYDFHGDRGGAPTCFDACARTWAPLLSQGAPQAGEGVSEAMLGTTSRKDGGEQVTFAGWPLYTYDGDHGPGEANGNGLESFGFRWRALRPTGEDAQG